VRLLGITILKRRLLVGFRNAIFFTSEQGRESLRDHGEKSAVHGIAFVLQQERRDSAQKGDHEGEPILERGMPFRERHHRAYDRTN